MWKNKYILADSDEIFVKQMEKAAEKALNIVERNMKKFASGDEYPSEYNEGHYMVFKNGDPKGGIWMEGFWTGQLWLCYELTGNKKFSELAEKNVVDFHKRVVENNQIDWHHDTGFLYTPSCVAAYKVTENELAKEAAEIAAYSLSRRFRIRGEFIQSMGFELESENYRFIVDTMMNLPLLFWAAEVTGNEAYYDKAKKHAETTRKYIVREDGSTFHHFLMDFETAGPKGGITWQGVGDTSCWSRGQAWMIYGSALMYAYTGDSSWITTFEKVADYFLMNLPADFVPYWDFSVSGAEGEPRDSSAAAIAVCGILEMMGILGEEYENWNMYVEAVKKIMNSLVEHYSSSYESGEEGLLLGVTHAKPQGMIQNCTTYGDYFYLEALIRIVRSWGRYW